MYHRLRRVLRTCYFDNEITSDPSVSTISTACVYEEDYSIQSNTEDALTDVSYVTKLKEHETTYKELKYQSGTTPLHAFAATTTTTRVTRSRTSAAAATQATLVPAEPEQPAVPVDRADEAQHDELLSDHDTPPAQEANDEEEIFVALRLQRARELIQDLLARGVPPDVILDVDAANSQQRGEMNEANTDGTDDIEQTQPVEQEADDNDDQDGDDDGTGNNDDEEPQDGPAELGNGNAGGNGGGDDDGSGGDSDGGSYNDDASDHGTDSDHGGEDVSDGDIGDGDSVLHESDGGSSIIAAGAGGGDPPPSAAYLTKILTKQAYNQKLAQLWMSPNMQQRRRLFNVFLDDLKIVFLVSPWTAQALDQWPRTVTYYHRNVSVAIYNVVFAYCAPECKDFIRQYGGEGRAALKTLQQQMAQITPEYLDRVQNAFLLVNQGPNKSASTYFRRFRSVVTECIRAGMHMGDEKQVKRLLRSMDNNPIYAATLEAFKTETRRAVRRRTPLPSFDEIESEFLSIDENQGIAIAQQRVRARPQQQALQAQGGRYRNRRGAPPQRRPEQFCVICRGSGHQASECPNQQDRQPREQRFETRPDTAGRNGRRGDDTIRDDTNRDNTIRDDTNGQYESGQYESGIHPVLSL